MNSNPDWVAIKADYVESAMTLTQVQEKHGVPRGTLSARATREKWNDEKQQFAANVEQQMREKSLHARVRQQLQFEDSILKIATGQLGVIVKQMQGEGVDAAMLLKLANALEKVQRIGCNAFGR
jgi:hypothetical protein